MYLVMVDSPRGDSFVSLGKTKTQAVDNLIKAYKDRYDMTLEDLYYEHGYNDFESYFDDYLGMNIYTISEGETIVCGYDIHYKNGKRIK